MSEDNAAFAERRVSAQLKHTPGPWQSRHDWDWDGFCDIIGNIDGDTTSPTYTHVCDIDEGCEEFAANRNLICAAPDLLKALKGMADAYVALLLMKAEDPSRFKEPGSPYANALAAIAKAGAAQ